MPAQPSPRASRELTVPGHERHARVGRLRPAGRPVAADPGRLAGPGGGPRVQLVVLATDVTHGRLLRLPWDYALYHLDPDEQSVADAVRCSLSIPFHFRPCTVTDPQTGETSVIVDGGILSNFAVEIFDRTDGKEARWPTFGVRIMPDLPAGIAELFPPLGLVMSPPLRLLQQVVAPALVGRDQTHLERPGVRQRTLVVDCARARIATSGSRRTSATRWWRRGAGRWANSCSGGAPPEVCSTWGESAYLWVTPLAGKGGGGPAGEQDHISDGVWRSREANARSWAGREDR
ncbi:patatin-like phospholipase family protein [Streptomyces sp. H27-C3]|uniref:patatin-like phospholipase family protein n=1 Tax=Streptomyces sp. H27-C3 TaxID=3046305 RepID=UPI0024B8FEE2|nr:patatin-like phospholipase family protein [Streptomyces sp. H27-C3]MDJ0465684.1 patatin-like phospholipase family protein [Streptomyces sp. H27-C3]